MWAMAAGVLYFAISRIISGTYMVDGGLMLILAIIGIIFDIAYISYYILVQYQLFSFVCFLRHIERD